MYCLPSVLNIMFLCLVEVPINAGNNTKIFKISADVKYMTTLIQNKTLVLSSAKDHKISLIKVNSYVPAVRMYICALNLLYLSLYKHQQQI